MIFNSHNCHSQVCTTPTSVCRWTLTLKATSQASALSEPAIRCCLPRRTDEHCCAGASIMLVKVCGLDGVAEDAPCSLVGSGLPLLPQEQHAALPHVVQSASHSMPRLQPASQTVPKCMFVNASVGAS